MRVAVIGSGISGLAAAHTLLREGKGRVRVTLYEAADYFGGHTHTVDVTLPGPAGPVTHGVDTGFLVFNQRTYPGLIALFDELGVDTSPSEMSFSVQVKDQNASWALEWSGTSLSSVFAQRRNLLSWRFIRMLRDLNRFNQLCTCLANSGTDAQQRQPLGEFLNSHGFSQEFREWYFLPMVACIWSCPTEQMLQFPVATLIRFCHNHGLLQVRDRPQWWTVTGGARHYVDKITAQIADKRLNTPVLAVERAPLWETGRVRVTTKNGAEYFDKLIFAVHPQQALALLQAPSPLEVRTLGAIRYHANRAVLHTDESVLPSRRTAWAAWNYERAVATAGGARQEEGVSQGGPARDVCLHYLINKLQPLPWQQSVIVSLNPLRDIPAEKTLGEFAYSHPVFDAPALKAQRQMPWLQGRQGTFYCGAWCGYGFHEDGLKAGVAAAHGVLGRAMNQQQDQEREQQPEPELARKLA